MGEGRLLSFNRGKLTGSNQDDVDTYTSVGIEP